MNGPRVKWWRVETDSKGKVLFATSVPGPGEAGGRLFYVEAASVADAKALGRVAYTLYCRNKVRETRARNDANGLCRCGCKRDVPGQKRCSKCIRLEKGQKARHYQRSKGVDVPPPDRFETVSAEKERARIELRLDVLREVNRQMVALKNDRPKFVAWLVGEIEKASAATRDGAA